ncbi:hypothetical protein [Coleofasciculus sp.]
MQIQKNACQLTILVENTAYGRGLLGEHGLSYLIETDFPHEKPINAPF